MIVSYRVYVNGMFKGSYKNKFKAIEIMEEYKLRTSDLYILQVKLLNGTLTSVRVMR